MKKGFLSVLLTLGMVLIMLPTTAYADSTWCDTCNKRVTVRYEYEYKDAQWHWNHTYCLECGKNTSNPRTKHQWSGTATCTSGRICTICGGTSNPLGHAYESSVTTKPTCTTDGVRTYVCKNDSSHTYTEPIPAAGHNYESSVTTEATCTTDGVRTYVCKNDSSHTYTEPIPAAHDWNSIWFSDENNHWHECNACAETTDVGEHIWNSGVITTSPTCTTAGEKTYTCSGCGRIKTEVISATGHNLEKVEKKDAGCTKDGYEAYWRCQTCKKLFSDATGTAEISNPTVIKATGHNLEKVEKKGAGCTEDGYETYWKCNTCKKLFSDAAGTAEISNPTAIKATGHNLKKIEKKDATATEEGNSTYWFCDKCNKYFSDAKAETEIKKEDTVLAKLSTVNQKKTEASSAKTANATKVTSTTDKTTKSSPKTGDSTDVQLYVILMLVSIGAAAGAGAKRKLKTQR